MARLGSPIRVSIKRTAPLGVDSGEVWPRVGGFGAIADWHPSFGSCALASSDGSVWRALTVRETGALVFEIMIEEGPLFYSYSILKSPLPIGGHIGFFWIEPLGGRGACRLCWEVSFVAATQSVADDAGGLVARILDRGLRSVQRRYPSRKS